MDAVKGRPFQYTSVPIRVHANGGGFDADDISGGGETMSSPEEMSTPIAATPVNSQCSLSRSSELTISFEGEVYVFPAVTSEQVQAVLLLLGGREIPNSIPSSEFLLQISDDKGVDDVSSQPMVSRRIASLERFREKRKERCFDKKIRYTCRKEVAQRMQRKNGQFASVQDTCKPSDDNWDSGNSTHPEPVLRRCQNCGVSETSTPAMRRGPAGSRTLCNACGLMWANKGTLRDLAKGGRHTFEQNEPEPLEIKPSATEPANSYCNQDEELAGHGTPEQTKHALLESGNPSVRTEQELMEITEGIADDSSIGIENSSGKLDEQETLDELTNGSGTEFEIPANFDEQQVAVDSHIGSHWPET